MLKRKIYDKLVEWKKTKKNECLLIKGARQIGKTYIIREFGEKQYKSFVEINFVTNPEYKQIFDEALDAQTIYKKISLLVPNVKFVEKSTLIFFDEIQDCPNARTALKFLAIDNKYDVIASGSLIGIHYKEITSIPVGYERQMEMYSLDFEEYLWAIGKSEQAIKYLKEYFVSREKIPTAINDEYLSLLREYAAVGGMPEVVNEFIKTNSFQAANAVQTKILQSYKDDINKYASSVDRQKIADCYNSIPRQLAKEYKKFQYKTVDKEGSAKKYESSLEWLIDAGMIKKCTNVSLPQIPLVAYEKAEQFKVYVTDIGLLTNMYGFTTQSMIVSNKLVGPAKGGIYENLIFDILTKLGCKLYYYKNERNTQEIEFLIEQNENVVPIEVKSGNGASVSLNTFIDEFKPDVAYKLVMGNTGVVGTKVTLPLYLALFIC